MEQQYRGLRTQNFRENEDQNHANEQSRLLGSASDTRISNDPNGKSSCQTCKTDGQPGTQLDETREEGDVLAQVVGDEDGDDKPIDTNDTSHDNRNDVWRRVRIACATGRNPLITLDNQVGSEDTHC